MVNNLADDERCRVSAGDSATAAGEMARSGQTISASRICSSRL